MVRPYGDLRGRARKLGGITCEAIDQEERRRWGESVGPDSLEQRHLD